MSSHADAPGNIQEIDGLRGIAVLAVVLYHFWPQQLPGGFVGVDVFFVVSGFLIGGILWRELTATGSIRIGAFLLRRLRRLAPAYFAMAIVTTVVAALVLLPFEFREYGKSLIATVVYLSNVQFFREAGYFDTASDEKILLHTWSLSVEEQFYLTLPVLLLLLARRKRTLVPALCALFAASLIACVLLTPSAPTATFFLFPFRAWELLMGVLLAIAWSERRMSAGYGPLLSFAGLACILAGFMFVRAGDGFPGLQALLPTVGTAMLLANIRDRNPVNTALRLAPLVSLGLVSYSLYLWHWPILTLSKYYFDGYSGAVEAGAWLAVSLVVATLSWRFVERPVRMAKTLPTFRLVGAVAAASLVLLAGGGLAYVGNGMPERFGPGVRTHIEASADFLQDWSRCRVDGEGAFAGIEVCPVGAPGAPSFVVWGDSHLRAFKEGIDLLAHEQGTAGLLIWRAGCPPLFGIEKRESAATPSQNAECFRANETLRGALAQLAGINRILLVGRWAYYAEGKGVGDDAGNIVALWKEGEPGGEAGQDQIFSEALDATVGELSASFPAIYALAQVPEVPRYDSRAVARRLAHGGDPAHEALRFTVAREDVASRTARSAAAFERLASQGRITLLDLNERLCGEVCSAIQGARSFYFDNNHVTNAAAIALRDAFMPVVAPRRPPDGALAANLDER